MMKMMMKRRDKYGLPGIKITNEIDRLKNVKERNRRYIIKFIKIFNHLKEGKDKIEINEDIYSIYERIKKYLENARFNDLCAICNGKCCLSLYDEIKTDMIMSDHLFSVITSLDEKDPWKYLNNESCGCIHLGEHGCLLPFEARPIFCVLYTCSSRGIIMNSLKRSLNDEKKILKDLNAMSNKVISKLWKKLKDSKNKLENTND